MMKRLIMTGALILTFLAGAAVGSFAIRDARAQDCPCKAHSRESLDDPAPTSTPTPALPAADVNADLLKRLVEAEEKQAKCFQDLVREVREFDL